VVQIGGEWYYEEFARGNGVTSLGVDGRALETNGAPGSASSVGAEERRNAGNASRP
jgi:penicillin-binding protein 1A